MTSGPGGPPRPLWDRASLPSTVAIARATRIAAVALVVVTLVAVFDGVAFALATLGGGVVVLGVLWGSAQVLIAGARRLAPALTLGLALAIYLVAIVGLFVLTLVLRGFGSSGDLVRPAGVAVGILTVVVSWTIALLVVHVRHDRGPRTGGRRGRRRDRSEPAPDTPRKPV